MQEVFARLQFSEREMEAHPCAQCGPAWLVARWEQDQACWGWWGQHSCL